MPCEYIYTDTKGALRVHLRYQGYLKKGRIVKFTTEIHLYGDQMIVCAKQ